MDAQLKRGILEVSVLAALLESDSYGYQIIKDVSPYFSISESTLYPVLRRLEKNGDLTVYDRAIDGRNRRYYAITPMGRQQLAEYRRDWHQYRNGIEALLFAGGKKE